MQVNVRQLNRARRADTHSQRVVVPVVYIAAMFMAIMDTTIISTALPALGRGLHAANSVGLVPIAYLVALTVFIPAAGWLGDRVGGRRALLGAIGLFTAASVLAGVSTSLGELVAFQALQGVGGAVMTPVGLAMLFRIYPPAERVRIAASIAVFTSLAPALGPILGGLLTTDLSWRWVFFVNVPVGVGALVFGALRLADHSQPHPGPLDIPGLILSALGLGAAMYGVSEGPTYGWSSAGVFLPVLVGVALLTLLVVVELRVAHPLINLRLLGRHRLFAACTGMYGVGSVAYIGSLFLAALFFQDALGLSALQSGLATFPSALGVMAGGQLVTRVLYQRVGPRRIVVAGLAVMAATLGLLASFTPATSLWWARLIMFVLGLGVAMVFIPSQAASMATIGKAETGQASSIFNAAKQLGSALGVALLTSVLATVEPAGHTTGHAVDLAGYHAAFLAAAVVAIVAAPVALAIRDADAVGTMSDPGSEHENTAGQDVARPAERHPTPTRAPAKRHTNQKLRS